MLSSAVLILTGAMVVGQADVRPQKADEYASFFSFFNGHWKGSVVFGDETFDVTWTYKQTPDNKCQICFLVLNGQHACQILSGYDPETKRWKSVYFWSNGGHSTSLDDAVLPKEARAGAKWRASYAGFAPDGSTIRGDVTWEITADDAVALRITNLRHGDNALPDWIVTVQRQ
jgi:hypothetical protein